LLDDFWAGILAGVDLSNTLLLVVSDHGNFEDWTTHKHTQNPSLTILTGAGFHELVSQLKSLVDIKPAILSYIFGT
jgi:bisphosphoglycerate-independent phosphoglycerate mutase (AlkP superfamily)